MNVLYSSNLIVYIACLELICSHYTSLGYDVVYPRLFEERSDDELLVAIRPGQNLTLRKASVMREELQFTTFEQDTEIIYYMNGSRMEQDIYCDPQALASIRLTRSGGLRLVGIISPTERIEPSSSEQGADGLVEHYVIPITLQSSDNDNNTDTNLQGTDTDYNSTSYDVHSQIGSTAFKERSGESNYPVKATCETRLVVDTAYFSAFDENKERLVKYLGVLVAFANLKFFTFQPNIVQLQVTVTGIVILSKAQESFIEKYDYDYSIMLRKTLDRLNLFVQNQSLFKDDDVVVLFTGLNVGMLYTNPPTLYTDIVGLAEVRGACSSKKAAIVEDLPRTFTAAHTFVHEVGHLVGSEHDGATLPPDSPNRLIPQRCSAYEKYIMSPILRTGMKQEFSWCSAVQVASYLLSDQGKCLTKTTSRPSKKLTFADVNETRPSLDEFCERHYEEYPGTRYLRGIENCRIACSDPKRPHLEILNDAPDGTPCNTEKPRMICLNSKCTRARANNHVRTFELGADSVVELT